MEKHNFYQELVELEEIEKLLVDAAMPDPQREHLLDTVNKTIHLEMVKFVLDEIPKEQHEEFLRFLDKGPSDNSLDVFVRRSVDNFEDRARDLIHHIKLDFKSAIHDYLESSEEWLAGDLN